MNNAKKEETAEQEISSKEESGRKLNPQRLLFTWCPNVSFAVVFQVAQEKLPWVEA